MSLFSELKTIWKKLGINGQVRNYSSVELSVLENDTKGIPIAHILPPGYKTPKDIDIDGFKRVDGKSVSGHTNWWKFYDLSIVNVEEGKKGLKISMITKTAVKEDHFGKVTYIHENWGSPIVAIIDVKRDSSNKIISYYVNGYGWLDFETTFKMTCYHEIDNARPVFPIKGKPYIRRKRDKYFLNNLDEKGKV
ncbi:MAG: hypothetical protein A2381_08570 [Bdellovibrionales bacterium RIFOXYB1_FULL_37_110]|nr:MAG: hypothetical protein A2417_14245 [Bdellovibrionales bacterium RIFOXYC1_FULL_37_79]OFZ58259.1 MAG: hypothetical protein A2381_08570 [Bdellovibrionales bacterium RIFOXYB1_FULL_37_110]